MDELLPGGISFGQWLRQRRRMLDLTQQEFADQVGCARITLRRIESGALKPSRELALILLKRLGVPEIERPGWVGFARGISGFPEKPADSLTSQPKTNLPAPLTSFIGREREQKEIRRLVEKHRLVTLIGPGGVGKTRLSLEVGKQVSGDYADGVWLVELAPILDPLLVPRIMAIAIGLRDEPQRPVIDMLSGYLHEKNMLILLDNCEHLLDACAHLAHTLLKHCPQLKILATSREVLGVLGEAVYQVPSLGLPNFQEMLEKFRASDSVCLFEERAQLIQTDFSVTMENVATVAKICSQLDGIPLAIELAAARVGTFSTEQIAARLQENLHLLTIGNRTALPRHQTLRAAIDWSYDLLSPAEQTLFRRLSVFVNGWTLEAAEAICSDANVAYGDVSDLLAQLIKKSLVHTDELRGVTRYRMLETIRLYADEKLTDSGGHDAVRRQHLAYFLGLAEAAELHLRRAEQIEWLNRLDAEHENLRAALTWAMDQPEAETSLRLAAALGTFWSLHAYWLEGAGWLDRVLSKAWDQDSHLEKAARARALYRRADLAHQLDDEVRMSSFAEAALALCQEVDDRWGIAYSRAALAYSLWRMGDPKGSRPLLEQSLNEFQGMGDGWGQGMVLTWLAGALILLGMQREYLESRQRALVAARRSGDRELIAISLRGYGADLVAEGNPNEAEKALQEAEQLFTEIGSSSGINEARFLKARMLFGCGKPKEARAQVDRCFEHCLRSGETNLQAKMLLLLGLIAEFENDPSAAAAYVQRGVNMIRELGQPEYLWWNIALARLQSLQGHFDAAKQPVRESLELVKRRGIGMEIAYVLHHTGGLLLEEKTQLAVQFLACADSLRQGLAFSRDATFDKPYSERFLSEAHEKLSETEFISAWTKGVRMTKEEGLGLALRAVEQMRMA